jgi:alpha-mannosidase
MKHYCVISHTHWDREWYKTQEQFRLSLIDLIDHLLEILDTQPDYIFHMDAQTIVFEDYWEIKPEMKEKCCQYIKEGRILVGPWYVQNDFYLTSGEATVRNLLLGMDQADKMGKCSLTGYMPDQFGLISQLPQILRGFDINHCVFGRGYDGWYIDDAGNMQKEKRPAEFMWRSPNGSEILAVCMSNWYNNTL